jgi:sigma-B regulation protein RsbU (phosphoserine phosphatase)
VGAPEISVLGEEFSRAAIHNEFSRCRQLLTALQGWRREWVPPGLELDKGLPPVSALQGLILVVDDELPNRRFLEKLLTECGADVLLAESGEQALELIQRHRPDVALVDVMMPGISGYEVCERVTQSREVSQTAVIMVTAKSTVEDVEHAFEKGAFDYIRKPFHSRELMARVRNALLLKKNTEALKNWKDRVSHDLEMAGTVQSRLFDPTPVFAEEYDFRVAYQPSQHIGGDMFDFHRLADGRLLVYVADVAGHGVGSALITTLIKGLINEIISAFQSPGLYEIGNELHRRFRLCVSDPELYATMILVRFDPAGGRLESLSCGHPPPLVFDAHGKVLPGFIEEKGGMPVGMMPPDMGDPYLPEDEVEVELSEAASIYLYTDGLVEARNQDREECGDGGLLKVIEKSLADREERGYPDLVLEGIRRSGFDLSMDDCTLMTLQRIPPFKRLACGEAGTTLEEVDRLAMLLSDRLLEADWKDDSAILVRLLVTEHCANVVKHGRCPEQARLWYRLNRSPEGCALVLSDPGTVWDPDHWRAEKTRNPDSYAENGRGLAMIDKISKRQQHFRRDNWNHSLYIFEKNLEDRLKAELNHDPQSI